MTLALKFPAPPGAADSRLIFVVPVAVLGQCVAAARAHFPREACGVALTKDGAWHWMLAENRSRRPETSYKFSRGALKTLDALAADGWALRAVWHSHPTGEIGLSPQDAEALAPGGNCRHPDTAQIILSLVNPAQPAISVTAWCWDPGARLYRPAKIYATAGKESDGSAADLLTPPVVPIA